MIDTVFVNEGKNDRFLHSVIGR